MQSLARIVPRLVFDSIGSPPVRRSLKIPQIPSVRASICLQCSIRTQVRRFADTSKPPLPSNTTPLDPSNVSQPNSTSPGSSPSPKHESKTPLTEETPSDLPSAEEGRRLAVTKRFSHLMDHLQGNIFIASQRINDLTGYSGIEALKERISTLERKVQDAQQAVRSARVTYKTTVADRAATQREVTTLLARKDSWTPMDLERFTALYRMDHSNEQAVQEAATRLADTEREAEHAASKLSSSILSRYHEEQIWSDKIRRMSTWGTWGLMGVNIFIFLVFQFGFEPWRRRRLVHGFEEKVREALEQEKLARGLTAKSDDVPLDGVIAAGIQELEVEIGDDKSAPEPAVAAVVACIQGEEANPTEAQEESETNAALDVVEAHIPTTMTKLRTREPWAPYIAAVEDLFSSRIIQMKKQDVTIIALEGAAIGATFVTIIATLLLRPS